MKFSGKQVPYFAYGVARIRVADEDLPMSPEEITNLLLKSGREGNRWENLVSDKSVDDVDEELLKKYTVQAHDDGRNAITYTDKKTVLNQLELTDGDKLLPALKLVDIAESYIKSNIHWKVEFTGTLQRTEIPEIPVDAIREALLNSFCHKDYSSGESNEVTIY